MDEEGTIIYLDVNVVSYFFSSVVGSDYCKTGGITRPSDAQTVLLPPLRMLALKQRLLDDGRLDEAENGLEGEPGKKGQDASEDERRPEGYRHQTVLHHPIWIG